MRARARVCVCVCVCVFHGNKAERDGNYKSFFYRNIIRIATIFLTTRIKYILLCAFFSLSQM